MKPILVLFYSLALFISAVSLTPLHHHGLDSPGPDFSSSTKRAIPDDHVKHEKRTVEQGRRWVKLKRADARATLPMRIGLKQHNLEKGHDLLMDMSDPASKNYGKHLTSAEVADLFAPSDASVAAVKGWLVGAGIPASAIGRSLNRQWIQFDVPVRQAGDLLAADYHVYEHEDSGAQTVACEEYHVPKHIQEHIDYVTPGIKLMSLGESHEPRGQAKKRSTYRGAEGIDRFILPVKMTDPAKKLKITANQTTSPNDGPSIPLEHPVSAGWRLR
ncbi:hypothetical protein PG997_001737 [Apiospora hydei]|uniref:Peptidase S53 activation domain-containing protein n=1 Tax=Apiospora hydei TaxID=1337664 RepID=A0ABR1XED1_9PEZI